ncbi:MAG TPA: hypothetical protein VEJ41_10035 [Candidatus Acidoferrales bacterium]|nr:hypothetical protein [Candidatus Acidoferrales bacterium]
MTRPERVLALGGIGVIASAILLVSYVTHSNADAAPRTACGADTQRLAQTLDQLRFATSAERALSSALEYSDRSRQTYYDEIKAMRLQPGENPRVQTDLVQASVILSDEEASISHAEAIAHEADSELHSGTPLVAQASIDLREDDCQALAITMAGSGWPKDHLLGQLADAARLNSAVNDRLDVALALITQAQALTR